MRFARFVFLAALLAKPVNAGDDPANNTNAAVRTPKPAAALPLCSTEKVNNDCAYNIDRKYPITLPTLQMRSGKSISVYVFHPYQFESLTLDAGTAQAFEGTDQASAFVTSATGEAKGAVLGIVNFAATEITAGNEFAEILGSSQSEMARSTAPPSDVALAKEILSQLDRLNALLTQAVEPLPGYFEETRGIYAAVREIESSQPRPVADSQGRLLRGKDVPPKTPDPWSAFKDWRDYMSSKISDQGKDTTRILDRLPQPCQKKGDPIPAAGPWLPSARRCIDDKTPGSQNSGDPFAISAGFEPLYRAMMDNLNRLPAGRPDATTFEQIQDLKKKLDDRKGRISQAIPTINELMPILVAKVSPDMQTLLANVNAVREQPADPTFLGAIPPPPFAPTAANKRLALYGALAPQITYTVNAQNEIANSLLSMPVATQKQAIASITVLYAEPHFEPSAGAFFSMLPNRTFANVTDTAVVDGVPAATDVRINMTKTIAPLVIPFVAGNYRISPEFTWLGRRRGALYATAGVALNPYNTQVEYAAGLSLSWRFLMFGPLFHLGHDSHLTGGEQPNQLWCQYAGATPVAGVPACSSGPPNPATKMFWRGAFAFSIAVRTPTTYSSTNH